MEHSTEERIGFIGLELSKASPKVTWPEIPLDPSTETTVQHILEVHRALVGKNAVRDEENLIQVSVFHHNGEVTVTPLVYLTKGPCNQVSLDLKFTSAVMFSLVEGSGPVHILATHCIAPSSVDDDDLEEEEFGEEDENDMNGYPPTENDFKPVKVLGSVDGSLEPLRKRIRTLENGQGEKRRLALNNETSESDEELNDEIANDV